jgi:hypothetical protein
MPARSAGLGRAGNTTLGSKFPPMPLGKSIASDKVGRAKLWTSTSAPLLMFYPIFDHLDPRLAISAVAERIERHAQRAAGLPAAVTHESVPQRVGINAVL